MQNTIELPETSPRIERGVIPDNWNPGDTKSINKFFNKIHRNISKRYK